MSNETSGNSPAEEVGGGGVSEVACTVIAISPTGSKVTVREDTATRVVALWFSRAGSSYSTDVLDMDLDLTVLDPQGGVDMAAIKQASMSPTRPMFKGPRISRAATPHTRSGSAAAGSNPSRRSCTGSAWGIRRRPGPRRPRASATSSPTR